MSVSFAKICKQYLSFNNKEMLTRFKCRNRIISHLRKIITLIFISIIIKRKSVSLIPALHHKLLYRIVMPAKIKLLGITKWKNVYWRILTASSCACHIWYIQVSNLLPDWNCVTSIRADIGSPKSGDNCPVLQQFRHAHVLVKGDSLNRNTRV